LCAGEKVEEEEEEKCSSRKNSLGLTTVRISAREYTNQSNVSNSVMMKERIVAQKY